MFTSDAKKLVRRLFVLATLIVSLVVLSLNQSARALSLCIDQVTEGIMNRFACLIGKRKNTVWGWQHGKAKIPMGDLLRICDRVGVSLVDFLYTEFVTQNEARSPTDHALDIALDVAGGSAFQTVKRERIPRFLRRRISNISYGLRIRWES